MLHCMIPDFKTKRMETKRKLVSEIIAVYSGCCCWVYIYVGFPLAADVVVFDNTYSWTRSKTVSYNIDILPPEDSTVVKDLDSVTMGGRWGMIAHKTECTQL